MRQVSLLPNRLNIRPGIRPKPCLKPYPRRQPKLVETLMRPPSKANGRIGIIAVDGVGAAGVLFITIIAPAGGIGVVDIGVGAITTATGKCLTP